VDGATIRINILQSEYPGADTSLLLQAAIYPVCITTSLVETTSINIVSRRSICKEVDDTTFLLDLLKI
jgi:hypothetical protein